LALAGAFLAVVFALAVDFLGAAFGAAFLAVDFLVAVPFLAVDLVAGMFTSSRVA